MASVHLNYVPLLALLLCAAATDVRARRIPNWLSVSLALSGLILSFSRLGTLSPWQSLLGLGAGLGIGFVMFALGAWGAGDAKLLTGIGAWLGAASVVWVTAGSAVLGLVAVLVWSVAAGRVGALLRGGAMLGLELASGSRPGTALAENASTVQLKGRTLPLAVLLLVATVGLLAFNLYRGG